MNEELLSRLDQLALKLGTTVDYMWPKLVSYTQMEAIMYVSLESAIMIASSYVTYKIIRKGIKESAADWIMFSGFTILLVLVCLLLIVKHIPIILVPEVEALKTIGNILK